MIKKVPPHDLIVMCEAVGVGLPWLSFFAGIDEETLISFARGEIGLSAADRLAIIQLLCASPCRKPGRPRRLSVERKKRMLDALTVLRAETVEELKALIEERRRQIGDTEAG